jgi:hypothetical protein
VTPSGTPQDFVTTPLKAPFSSFSATDAQVSHSGSQTVRPRTGYAEHTGRGAPLVDQRDG